jgi:uncharacterized membrane protein
MTRRIVTVKTPDKSMTPTDPPAATTPNDPDPLLFAAVLTPHRSLDARGRLVLVGAICVLTTGIAGLFLAVGAWPVAGFLGLDIALIWWALRANQRDARAFEEVRVTASELRVRKVSPSGQMAEWAMNPLWTRLDRDTHPEFGVQRLSLVTAGKRLDIAGFLPPTEKDSFGKALSAALANARRGPDRFIGP